MVDGVTKVACRKLYKIKVTQNICLIVLFTSMEQ